MEKINLSLTSKTRGLFFRDHQFEYYKFQGYCKLTWSLTSGFQKIS
jgi:hypothetical protein